MAESVVHFSEDGSWNRGEVTAMDVTKTTDNPEDGTTTQTPKTKTKTRTTRPKSKTTTAKAATAKASSARKSSSKTPKAGSFNLSSLRDSVASINTKSKSTTTKTASKKTTTTEVEAPATPVAPESAPNPIPMPVVPEAPEQTPASTTSVREDAGIQPLTLDTMGSVTRPDESPIVEVGASAVEEASQPATTSAPTPEPALESGAPKLEIEIAPKTETETASEPVHAPTSTTVVEPETQSAFEEEPAPMPEKNDASPGFNLSRMESVAHVESTSQQTDSQAVQALQLDSVLPKTEEAPTPIVQAEAPKSVEERSAVKSTGEAFSVVPLDQLLVPVKLSYEGLGEWLRKCLKRRLSAPAAIFSASFNRDFRGYNFRVSGNRADIIAVIGIDCSISAVRLSVAPGKVEDAHSVLAVTNGGQFITMSSDVVVTLSERKGPTTEV